MARFTGKISLDYGEVTNLHISNQAGAIIDAEKVQPFFQRGTAFSTKIGDVPVNSEVIVHVASGPGTLRDFHALLETSGASTDVQFDLKVNGVSVLSVKPHFTTSGTRMILDGTISAPALADGDVVSIQSTATVTTGAVGPWAWINLTEAALPS